MTAERDPRTSPRIGLALGAGGARGAAHTGVLNVFEREGIPIHVVAGSSIGALIGAAMACGVPHSRIENEWLENDVTKLFRSFLPTFPRTGLSSGNELHKYLAQLLGDRRIEDLEMPYAALACDIDTGEAVVLTEGSLPDAVCASTAIPGIFRPVRLNGRILVDGGLVDPVPISTCYALGADFVIAVDITARPQRTTSRTREAWDRIGEQILSLGDQPWVPDSLSGLLASTAENLEDRERPLPGVYSILNQSIVILQQEVFRLRLALHPPDVLIRPDVRMSIMGYLRAREGIEVGVRAAEAALPELRRKLAAWPGNAAE
jgi:NTE family protein